MFRYFSLLFEPIWYSWRIGALASILRNGTKTKIHQPKKRRDIVDKIPSRLGRRHQGCLFFCFVNHLMNRRAGVNLTIAWELDGLNYLATGAKRFHFHDTVSNAGISPSRIQPSKLTEQSIHIWRQVAPLNAGNKARPLFLPRCVGDFVLKFHLDIMSQI